MERQSSIAPHARGAPPFAIHPSPFTLHIARRIETALHALCFYAAGGIAAFGWAMCQILRVPAAPWMPLWFCGALLIYNADRLRRDPADSLNLPLRTAASTRLRGASIAVLAAAACTLIALPVWRRDWLTLGCVLIGGIVTLGYSIPIFGIRWKDVPLLKTLFAPAVVTLAVLGLPVLAEALPYATWDKIPDTILFEFDDVRALSFWSFLYLLFNMLLCDVRDREGDARCGIRSIPVVLGESRTRGLLWALFFAGQLLLALLLQQIDSYKVHVNLLSLLTGLYQCWLLLATERPRGERFYEWAVEALLYLPALAMLAPAG